MHFGIDFSTQPDRSAYMVIKQHGRMWIVHEFTLEPVYSPPRFITLPDRAALADLAYRFAGKGYPDIKDIMDFEATWHPNKKHRKQAITSSTSRPERRG